MEYMKTSIGIFIVTIISMILGFVRESVVVYKLGVSWQADSFNFTVLLPSFLFTTLGGVISTTFLPLYTDLRINKSLKDANYFASAFTNYIIIICFIIFLIGEFFTGTVVKFLAPGFKGTTYNLTVDLVRIVLPSLIFLGITYCLIGLLQSNKDLIPVSSITIPMHLSIIIALIFIYPKLGFSYSIVLVVFGSMVQLLIVVERIKKWHYKYYFKLRDKNGYLKQGFKMIGPMILGIMAFQINIMVDRMLASTLGSGSITSINLASKLNTASYSSIGYIVVMMIFPILAEYQAKGDMCNYGKTLNKGINIILTLMMPITVIMIFFSSELINLLFGYGKFTNNDIITTSQILVCYSLGICFLGMRDVLNRGFYSLKDTITPMKNSIISIILNIIVNLSLIKTFKARGIAISTTIAMIVCSMLLLKNIAKRVNSISIKDIGLNFIKIFISSLALLATIFSIKKLLIILNININCKLGIIIYIFTSSFIGIIIYVIFICLFRVEGVKEIKEKILTKIILLRK